MVDSGIVIVWVIVDPMEPKITNLTEEVSITHGQIEDSTNTCQIVVLKLYI